MYVLLLIPCFIGSNTQTLGTPKLGALYVVDKNIFCVFHIPYVCIGEFPFCFDSIQAFEANLGKRNEIVASIRNKKELTWCSIDVLRILNEGRYIMKHLQKIKNYYDNRLS